MHGHRQCDPAVIAGGCIKALIVMFTLTGALYSQQAAHERQQGFQQPGFDLYHHQRIVFTAGKSPGRRRTIEGPENMANIINISWYRIFWKL